MENTTKPVLKTVEQFSSDNPAFTQSSIRNLIFKAEARHTSKGLITGNGLKESGALKRLGRKVLIDEIKFYQWVDLQQMEAS